MTHDSQDEVTDYVPQLLRRPIRLFVVGKLLIRPPDPCDEPRGIIRQSLKIGLVFSNRLRVIELIIRYLSLRSRNTHFHGGENFQRRPRRLLQVRDRCQFSSRRDERENERSPFDPILHPMALFFVLLTGFCTIWRHWGAGNGGIFQRDERSITRWPGAPPPSLTACCPAIYRQPRCSNLHQGYM